MNIVNVGYRSTNYYVLADSALRLLVDAGWPGTLGTMQHACKRQGIELGAIPYQIATHYHPDHAGLAQELKRLGIRLIVCDTQLAAIPLLSTYVKSQDNYTDIESEGNIVVALAQSRTFLAGIGIRGEIISTPGHSDDCVTLILDDNAAAFTGDLTPPSAVPQDPANTEYQAWERIRAMGVKAIYPGHGPVRQI